MTRTLIKNKVILILTALSLSFPGISLGEKSNVPIYSDPMKVKKYVRGSSANKPLVLKAITMPNTNSSNEATCIIQDEVLKKGDVIKGYKIIKIKPHSVYLVDKNNNLMVLSVHE